MRIWCSGAAAVLQVLILAFMAGEREFVATHGTGVWLRTVPVDPRDLFRGDYVRLGYEASAVPRERCTGITDNPAAPRGARVYAALVPRPDGLMEVSELTTVRPETGLFIRGRIESQWQQTVNVRYGIEAFFMQQGKALELERRSWPEGVQVPLEMDVALGRNGMAVLRGYRQAPLGLGLNFETGDDGRLRTGRITVRLLNASGQPLAIVDLPGQASLALVAANPWQPPKAWRWVGARERPAAPSAEDIHLLAPGELYSLVIDLNQPAWFITREGEAKPRSLHGLAEWDASFRLQYRTPEPAACAGLPQAERLWHGDLLSSRFNGMQQLD